MAEAQNKINYIRFPISFIRDMLVDKEAGIKKMILYGYSLVADKSEIDEWSAYHQVMYCFYRYRARGDEEPDANRNSLPYYIWNEMTNYVNNELLDIDDSHFGFDVTGESNIDHETKQLIELGKDNPKFHNMVMDFHRVRQTADLFSIKINDYNTMLEEYRKYCGRDAMKTRMVSVKLSQLLEYLFQRKTEAQLMVFAAYMGVKAIIGKEPFKQTTKSYIIANMFGCMNEVELQTMLVKPGNETLLELHKKYTTRKMFDNITTGLKESNFIPEWYPCGKAGTFVSCKLNHKQFVREVAKALDNRGKEHNTTRLSAKDYRRATRFEIEEVRNNASG
jgi:hypothetical protein